MTSIKDWQDSMSEVDGWAEATDFIDEDDVKRWTADKKMDPQKFKSALAFSLTSETMRVRQRAAQQPAWMCAVAQ